MINKKRNCSAEPIASPIFGRSLDRNGGVRRLLHHHDAACGDSALGAVWRRRRDLGHGPCALQFALIMTALGVVFSLFRVGEPKSLTVVFLRTAVVLAVGFPITYALLRL